jgi:hypothetical protein
MNLPQNADNLSKGPIVSLKIGIPLEGKYLSFRFIFFVFNLTIDTFIFHLHGKPRETWPTEVDEKKLLFMGKILKYCEEQKLAFTENEEYQSAVAYYEELSEGNWVEPTFWFVMIHIL